MLQKPEDQSLIPRAHKKVEGENQLYKVVLRPPHICCGTLAYNPTHNNKFKTNQSLATSGWHTPVTPALQRLLRD